MKPPRYFRNNRLNRFLRSVEHFRGDGSVGSIERAAGIRNREALWMRASRIVGFNGSGQALVDCAMNRCRRLRALRMFRHQPLLPRAQTVNRDIYQMSVDELRDEQIRTFGKLKEIRRLIRKQVKGASKPSVKSVAKTR